MGEERPLPPSCTDKVSWVARLRRELEGAVAAAASANSSAGPRLWRSGVVTGDAEEPTESKDMSLPTLARLAAAAAEVR